MALVELVFNGAIDRDVIQILEVRKFANDVIDVLFGEETDLQIRQVRSHLSKSVDHLPHVDYRVVRDIQTQERRKFERCQCRVGCRRGHEIFEAIRA